MSNELKGHIMGYREEFFKHNQGIYGVWFCARCRKRLKKSEVEVDHIWPQSKSGPDHHFNLQSLCRPCNRKKSNKVNRKTAFDFAKKGLWHLIKKVLPSKK